MNIEVVRGTFGDAPFSAREAAQALGLRNAASALTRWKQSGLIARTGRGMYVFLQEPRTASIGLRLERMDVERRDEDSIRTLAEIAKRQWDSALESATITPTARGYRWRVKT